MSNSSMQAQSATSQPNASALPERWIAALFGKMEDRYGDLWAHRYGANPRERMMRTWAEDLSDMTREEIAHGVQACRDVRFPPTLPEFRQLCRPPIDYEASFIEAAEQLHRRDTDTDRWSSPVVFWAASRMASEVRSLSWQQAAGRWRNEIDKAAAEIKAGTLPNEVPKRLTALPPPGETTPCPEDVRRRINEMMARLKGGAA